MAACFPGMHVDLSTPPNTPPRPMSRSSQPLEQTPRHQKASQAQRGVKRPVVPSGVPSMPIVKTEPLVQQMPKGQKAAAEQRGVKRPVVPSDVPSMPIVKTESIDDDPDEAVPLTDLAREAPDSCVAVKDEAVDDAGKDDGKDAGEAKKRKLRKKMVELGSQLCRRLKMSFHDTWHPRHKYMVPPGHWEEFRLALATKAYGSIKCETCRELLSEMELQPASSGDPNEDPMEALTPTLREQSASKALRAERLAVLRKEEGLDDSVAKGRRKKVEQPPLHQKLFDWITARRATVYTKAAVKEGQLMLHCQICQLDVNAKRDSTIHFLLQHEASESHWQKVRGAQPRLCRGLKMEAESQLTTYHVQTIGCTFGAWVEEGMPWHMMKECGHGCYVDAETKEPWIRSQACERKPSELTNGEDVCRCCRALANSKKFVGGVARWGFCFDAVALMHATYTGNRKMRKDVCSGMEQADYASLVLPELRVTLREIQSMDFYLLRKLVQRLFGYINHSYRNDAANKYLASRYEWLPSSLTASHKGDVQK